MLTYSIPFCSLPFIPFSPLFFPFFLLPRGTEKIMPLPLRRGHANLLCIVPILVYVLPKQVQLTLLTHLYLYPRPPSPNRNGVHRLKLTQKVKIQRFPTVLPPT